MMQVYLISGINTERTLGTTVSSRTVKNEVMKLANQNRRVVDSAIMNAIENEYLIVAMIDDYTTIHSYHRPTDNKASTCRAMCTIVCRIFPSVPAIPITSLESLHCPSVIDLHRLVADMISSSSMHQFSRPFSESMQEWIRESFFNLECVRHRLDVLSYHHSKNVRKMRCLANLYLIDFIEQLLKSKYNSAASLEALQKLALKECMKKYPLIMPGDWPTKFHVRQDVYSSLKDSTFVTHKGQTKEEGSAILPP